MKRPAPRAILLDMDGLLYHGDQPLPGAAGFLRRIAELPHAFVTNNPIRSPERMADAMRAMGLPRPDPARIVTSALATARWLSGIRPGFRYFAVGAPGLDEALRRVGRPDAERAEFVVVGEGAGLDYEQLTIGINLILGRGARLVATNPDPTVDAVEHGRHLVRPGCGALVAPFAAATGVTPTVIGKPEPLLYEMALGTLGQIAAETLMVGDRMDTDIAGAERIGLWTALVRSGRYPPGRPLPEELPAPDFDVASLDELTHALSVAFPGWIPDT